MLSSGPRDRVKGKTRKPKCSAKRWGPWWSGKRVKVFTDSTAAQGIINKGSCKEPLVMQALRELFWLSATYNFHITALHLARQFNQESDWASCLHDWKNIVLIDMYLYPNHSLVPVKLLRHISYPSFVSIFAQVQTWWHWKQQWTVK